MRPRHTILHFFLVTLALAAATPRARACIWDSDTLAAERRRFPGTIELVAGHFLRHSPAFYQWRVKDREQRLTANPDDIAAYDDLAVALDKLGQHAKAIDVMQRKEQRKPGLYETYANRGTFKAHGGDLAGGLVDLKKAVEINPDAHFGREIYQILLIEHVLADRGASGADFAGFVRKALVKDAKAHELPPAELAKALKGVQGMMRFGQHDHPVLLAALGSLLSQGGTDRNAALLAGRAYLRAARMVPDPAAKKRYEDLASQAVHHHQGMTVDALARQLDDELRIAGDWYAELEANETQWIAEGQDPERRYAETYDEEPTMPSSGGVVDSFMSWFGGRQKRATAEKY